MAVKKMKVLGLVTLTEMEDGKPVSIPPGEKPVSLEKEEAESLIKRKMAIAYVKGDEVAPVKAAPVKKPTTAQIGESLANEIFPNLTEEEWGEDKEPNLDVLIARLSEYFDQYVKIDAAAREPILVLYKEEHPEVFPVAAGGTKD